MVTNKIKLIMRTIFTGSFLMLFQPELKAQFNIDGQFLGSSFLGISLNASYDFTLSKSGNHILVPSIGYGISFYKGYGFILVGTDYRFKKFGTGCALLLVNSTNEKLIYPNVSYITKKNPGLFWKFSIGPIISLDANEILPWAGISLGYKFKRRNDTY